MKRWQKHKEMTKNLIRESYIEKNKKKKEWKLNIVLPKHRANICKDLIGDFMKYISENRRHKFWIANIHWDILDEELDGVNTNDVCITEFLKYLDKLTTDNL